MPDNQIDSAAANSKIMPLDELASLAAIWHDENQKVVHCHGVFDLLHPGHIKHLEAAKCEGERLLVTLTPDRYVDKGPGRPIFDENMRAYSIASIECVDAVAINCWKTAVKTISIIKPDVYVKGSDYAEADDDVTGKIQEEVEAVKFVGGRFHLTDEVTFSSSGIINRTFDIHPAKTAGWISQFRDKHSVSEIFEYLDQIKSLKILVLGEAIIDEYVYCDGLGKASKDPILAFHSRGCENYIGGSLAVVNHLSEFCDHITVFSILGNNDNREEFIRNSLVANVTAKFVYRTDAPTIIKRRYIDSHTKAKIFEIYEMGNELISLNVEDQILEFLNDMVHDFDLVLVTDYGHGFFTPAVISKVTSDAKFLVVNAQHNAGNRGFNTIARYRRADYICFNGQELALETRQRQAPTADQLLEISKTIDCPSFTVTLGENGSLHFDAESGFYSAPAFAARVVDRVGAGDAVMAISAPLVACGAPWDIVGLISNVVGAEMVSTVGNRNKLTKSSIANQIKSLLK